MDIPDTETEPKLPSQRYHYHLVSTKLFYCCWLPFGHWLNYISKGNCTI